MTQWLICSLLLPVGALTLGRRDDAELVRGLTRRDPDAMAGLYDRYGRLVYSLLVRMIRNSAVAEDLVQETFLRVWTRVHTFNADRGALGPWIISIARNRAIDHLRSVDARESESRANLDRIENPKLFSGLEALVLNKDRLRALGAALERLTPNQRAVVELAYYEGLTQVQMAERLKQPLGTVKTWVRTALRTLRDELGQAVVA